MTVFDNEIEFCLEEIGELELILQKASSHLRALKQRLHALEGIQETKEMPELLPEIQETEKIEEKGPLPITFLGDKIVKTIYADLKKSLSLNDRFRFQRDLFDNNIELMDNTLSDLNNFSSFQETMDYLQSYFAWNWEDESAQAFKELLEKRFN
jgi:hypothetical protein